MMKKLVLCATLTLWTMSVGLAQEDGTPSSAIDYHSFMTLTSEVYTYRQERLLPLQQFLQMAEDPAVVVLDTRSKAAFDQKHLKGAIHLNFSDFTASKLAKLIPDKATKILIYCNNNIEGDEINFARKSPPLALNIPTFINLYGYGYHNLYELEGLIPADHEALAFEGIGVPLKNE